MIESKRLILFTSEFPYGIGEQFIETEILILANRFSDVYIYPLRTDGEKRSLPPNVKVIQPQLYKAYKRKDIIISNLFLIIKIFAITFLKSGNRFNYIKDFNRWFNYLLNRINDANWLESKLPASDNENTIYYSYWFNMWGTILSIIKARNKNFKFFSRIHGGDFDKERKEEKYFPFREFELMQIDHVYAVSNFGLNYMKKNYDNINFNINLSRLGVLDCGINPFDSKKGYIHIVSCSFFYKLKRVHLIVDILANLKNIQIVWTHFGNGELENTIKEYAAEKLGSNVRTDFKGLRPNSEIIEFYKSNSVDLFMNTSELEGIPVSMMEAISFGIPIFGCDICGVPEIANASTGILVPKIFDSTIAAKQITDLLLISDSEMENKRKQIKVFWDNNFNGLKNYNTFLETIS